MVPDMKSEEVVYLGRMVTVWQSFEQES
jgi:hypothetical protein